MKKFGELKITKFVKKRFTSVSEDETIENVLNIFKKEKLDALPVIKNGEFVGEIRKKDILKLTLDVEKLPEADIIKFGLGFDLGLNERYVKQLMGPHDIEISAKAKVKELVQEILKKDISIIPVKNGKKLVGVIYVSDIINEVAK